MGGAPALTIGSGGDGDAPESDVEDDGDSESDVEHDIESKGDSEEVMGGEVRLGALPTDHVDKGDVTYMDVAGGGDSASNAEPRLASVMSTKVVKATEQTEITSFFVRPPAV
eukprot:4055690-Prymnesium_polylepis.1